MITLTLHPVELEAVERASMDPKQIAKAWVEFVGTRISKACGFNVDVRQDTSLAEDMVSGATTDEEVRVLDALGDIREDFRAEVESSSK